jgi:hypothetical protein
MTDSFRGTDGRGGRGESNRSHTKACIRGRMYLECPPSVGYIAAGRFNLQNRISTSSAARTLCIDIRYPRIYVESEESHSVDVKSGQLYFLLLSFHWQVYGACITHQFVTAWPSCCFDMCIRRWML